MNTCKVKILLELSGVVTEPFKGMPKNEEETQLVRDIIDDIRTALMQSADIADIYLIESVEESKKG